ncbi:conserved hypothetical protein [Perkinsus marinus ATCC 50983]|uniref:Uncharacterized protein n=1 Tax=Perkinsus marinus (strain ATCC 50983 / TXsc) TaxID=423536 RepID=C5L2E3_PERM5|nr:conserved hypothetical protein [Perkinsus marinus ATCC 50983]EER09037.1 conserved hypothetical protein [Perkinsus marinus ATCC 50983]|eukprot:XP_002777221.1 conserved hypothetical protein [Perkinsus marinus ATCC 50983]
MVGETSLGSAVTMLGSLECCALASSMGQWEASEQMAQLKRLEEESKTRASQQQQQPENSNSEDEQGEEGTTNESLPPPPPLAQQPQPYQAVGGAWVPGRPADREEYLQQQQAKGGVPVVNAVVVPPGKVVGQQQQQTGVAAPLSYAAVASGASNSPRSGYSGAPAAAAGYYGQTGYTIPQAQIPMPPPRNLRVPMPELARSQLQQQSAPQEGGQQEQQYYAQPSPPPPAQQQWVPQRTQSVPKITTPSPPPRKVPIVGAKKLTRKSSVTSERAPTQTVQPPPQQPTGAPAATEEPTRVPGIRRKLTGNLSAAKGWPGAGTSAPPDSSEFKWPQQ